MNYKSSFLFTGLLYGEEDLGKVKTELEKKYGKIFAESPTFPFNWTNYYNQELGDTIKRKWFVYSPVVNAEEIWVYKLQSIRLEEKFKKGKKRTVNIDPGLLSLASITLLSTKPAFHRLYLSHNIWGELTLIYKKGSYRPLEWTYPDYQTKEAISFFNNIREELRKRLRNVDN